jgi:hypothetical protein
MQIIVIVVADKSLAMVVIGARNKAEHLKSLLKIVCAFTNELESRKASICSLETAKGLVVAAPMSTAVSSTSFWRILSCSPFVQFATSCQNLGKFFSSVWPVTLSKRR